MELRTRRHRHVARDQGAENRIVTTINQLSPTRLWRTSFDLLNQRVDKQLSLIIGRKCTQNDDYWQGNASADRQLA